MATNLFRPVTYARAVFERSTGRLLWCPPTRHGRHVISTPVLVPRIIGAPSSRPGMVKNLFGEDRIRKCPGNNSNDTKPQPGIAARIFPPESSGTMPARLLSASIQKRSSCSGHMLTANRAETVTWIFSVIMPARNELDQAVRIDRAVAPRFPLDLVVCTPHNVAWRLKEGDSFLRNVLTRGKVLYSADPHS